MALDVIAESIRDAIAPVFLMSGVASILGVTTSRFSRIVDRYRELMAGVAQTPSSAEELHIMYRRSRVIHWSIAACTISALLVCMLIGLLFVGIEVGFSPDRSISLLFIASMATLIVGLILFLYEVHLATGTLTILGANFRTGKDKKKKQAN